MAGSARRPRQDVILIVASRHGGFCPNKSLGRLTMVRLLNSCMPCRAWYQMILIVTGLDTGLSAGACQRKNGSGGGNGGVSD